MSTIEAFAPITSEQDTPRAERVEGVYHGAQRMVEQFGLIEWYQGRCCRSFVWDEPTLGQSTGTRYALRQTGYPAEDGRMLWEEKIAIASQGPQRPIVSFNVSPTTTTGELPTQVNHQKLQDTIEHQYARQEELTAKRLFETLARTGERLTLPEDYPIEAAIPAITEALLGYCAPGTRVPLHSRVRIALDVISARAGIETPNAEFLTPPASPTEGGIVLLASSPSSCQVHIKRPGDPPFKEPYIVRIDKATGRISEAAGDGEVPADVLDVISRELAKTTRAVLDTPELAPLSDSEIIQKADRMTAGQNLRFLIQDSFEDVPVHGVTTSNPEVDKCRVIKLTDRGQPGNPAASLGLEFTIAQFGASNNDYDVFHPTMLRVKVDGRINASATFDLLADPDLTDRANRAWFEATGLSRTDVFDSLARAVLYASPTDAPKDPLTR